ncbi:GspE/PulE family protein [Pseudoalteromonas sp. MMG022]|uniref:GspE/PulE family protein n=1 Tax=Pseudoalteromonas sp. MMG022 TaxID=2909978 RepID=UPI001F1DA83A|nr:GspE/PulE family protein [Pseudoalteromonas sp. MMG022]MCF6434944.1 GspE/PulE family protein [Pseudoalteromonas sp. MMG022]
MQTWNSKVHAYIAQKQILNHDRLQQLADFEKDEQSNLELILLNSGWIDEDQLRDMYCQLLNCGTWEQGLDTSKEFIEHLKSTNVELLLAHNMVPVFIDSTQIDIAFSNPHGKEALDYLRFIPQNKRFFAVSAKELELLGEQCRALLSDVPDVPISTDNLSALKELALGAPTVNLVNSLINKGVKLGASDLHIEPVNGKYRARYRIDGILKEADPIPHNLQLAVISRIKILSGMDIAEKRRPQDGKIEMKAGTTDLDIRCSTLPLGMGESVVMRFLIKNAVKFDLKRLGYSEDLVEKINQDLKRTSGVILMTGPTGSGKTTSLYSFLNQINRPDIKIVTLEDPIEYQLPGINQVQVNAEIGYDFSAGLRSIVRQDPDVIMVGEIRDNETAKIALQSALTGHLVFSTVHTNDAPSAYTRLMDLGIQEYLLNAGLVSIMAQRLARTLCEHCKQPLSELETQDLYDKYALSELTAGEIAPLYQTVGCEKCENTGYSGRVAFLEYLPCDGDVKKLAKDERLLDNLYELMREKKLRSLKQDGFLKAVTGQTTIEEVLRVAG